MKPNTLIFSVVLCCSCIIFMILLFCNKSIIKINTQTFVQIEKSFLKAIEIDSEKRLKDIEPIVTLGYRNLPDSLTHQNGIIIRTDKGEEFIPHTLEGIGVSKRMSIISQSVTAKYKPIQATSLDSIFQVELTDNGIHAHSLVRYQFNDDVYYSNSDLKLLSSNIHTEEIITGIYNEIKLQAFISYPPLERLKEIRTILSFFFCGLLISIAYLLLRKNKTSAVLPTKKEYAKEVQTPTYPLPPYTLEITETFRVEDIQFDFQENKLWINNNITKLTKQNIKLLKALLKAPDHYLKREEIYPYMWNDYIQDYNKLNKCTERLRETLYTENPRIEIITHPRRGIELSVVPLSEVSSSSNKDFPPGNNSPTV